MKITQGFVTRVTYLLNKDKGKEVKGQRHRGKHQVAKKIEKLICNKIRLQPSLEVRVLLWSQSSL